MNVLVVGMGAGSWQMRGVQLGQAMGARVTAAPTAADWAWADRVVLVKRAAMRWAAEARRLSVPVVWDALDFWAQPEDNNKPIEVLLDQVRATKDAAGVSMLIGATQSMARSIGGFSGVYVPHHCRLGLQPTPPRPVAKVVGYDGQKKYLGAWLPALTRACEAVGLRFVLNPPDITACDVLVSFRDGKWDGPACRQWKSGVKYVNAITAGRPILTQTSAAYEELRPIGDIVESPDELAAALQYVSFREIREGAYEEGRRAAASFQVSAVAESYRDILSRADRAVAA